MRYLLIATLILILSSCGKDGTNGISGTNGTGLQGLQGTQGATGPQGVQGDQGLTSSGLSIVSNKTIQRIGPDPYTGVGTNLCPVYGTTDTCSFEIGQLIQYSDGSMYLAGTYRMIRDDTPNSDTFYSEGFHAYVFNSTANSGSIVLTTKHYVSINNARILFLYWERSPEIVKLVIDTNQNKIADSGDTILQTLTVN